MKRIVTVILLAALLLTGLSFPAESRAESGHPITLTITCDPAPELESAGTIPDLLFTIRNTGTEDYTLYDARLFGGYEGDEKDIGGDAFSILAGSSKEFHLTDVPVSEDQLDREIVYRLTWNELEMRISEETGEATFITHPRETTASITLERFLIPELTVTASSEEPYVRADEPFTVTYTISNDTAFDITGIRLYDPEQSMQTIPLPKGELLSGERMTVNVEYIMGSEDMTFRPCIEYLSRRREMKTTASEALTVGNVSVDLLVETEQRASTAQGTVFAVRITNLGNRPVTDIRVFDEINTLIEKPFSLGPDENYTVVCSITPAVSSNVVRSVRFHVTATDFFGQEIRIDDPGTYKVVPYLEPDSVRLVLSAVLQSPYYNEDGKLCASVQFIIRNNSDVKIHNVVLKELSLFSDVKTYDELLEGDTYLMQVYQLDGVKELRFQVTALDPAGMPCSSDIVRLDLSGLKELADRKDDAVLVYTQNDYMQDIDTRYTGVLRSSLIIGLSVAVLCAIVCIILYAVEIRIRSKLPGEFEDEMERVLRSTKRRTPKQLFTDAPTEQFGYVAPIKLRNYGELTEEEAKERRELYAKRLEESIRKEGGKTEAAPKRPIAERIDDDGTRVIPVARRTAPQTKRPQKDDAPDAVTFGTQVIPVVHRKPTEPDKTPEAKTDGTQVIPVVRPNPVVDPVPQAPIIPTAEEESEPIRIYEPKRSRPAKDNPPDSQSENVSAPLRSVTDEPSRVESRVAVSSLAQGGQNEAPETIPEPETEHDPEPVSERTSENAFVGDDDDAKDDASASSRDGSYVTERTDLDVPPETEHEPEPEEAHDPVGTGIARPPEEIHAEPIAEPEPEPEPTCKPAQSAQGLRRAFEKPVPARRPVELHPIRRIGR